MRRPVFALAALAALTTACRPAPPPTTTPPAAGATAAAATDAVFPSANRPDVRGTVAAVSSDHPLATAAGHDVLRRGGNATDAALAMAGVLAVVRPHMNGVGGDAFALFYDGASRTVTALDGSGRAGRLATPAFFRERGHDDVPGGGALSVSVPGAVAAWVDAHERYGSLPLAELLAPAIGYARDGFPVSWRLRSDFQDQGGDLNAPGRALYLPGGQPPPLGGLLKNPALARTLERIAKEGKAGFYRGPVAERIAAFVEAEGGYLRAGDLAEHTSTWVEPLAGDYLGHRFHVLPPATQGVAMLAQMEMAKSFDINELGHNTSSYLHTLIELKKRAFADRDRFVADPAHVDVPVERMLDPAYLRSRAAAVDAARAAEDVVPGFGRPVAEGTGPAERDDGGDTVYLTVVDAEGNAVSWIQSLFAGFGSGLLEPETGVMLQNRGALFTLNEDHPNVVAPGKRPYHTLSPALATSDGRLAFTVGTPGGDSQTQSILQIVHNLLLFDMTPQEAVEAPRYRSYSGTSVALEDRVAAPVVADLEARGHRVRVVHGWTATFGGAQMIVVDPRSGTLAAAADPRREAYALAW
ncbi:MAG: gamma-glutamyltransferase [Gemmatimonadetes bacterium]|nr:gamma-glutamyltransferase [Gemmatimonadota bacterium]